MPEFKQETFDARLMDMITDAVDREEGSIRVKAGDLELRVVGRRDGNNQRTPMACHALRKVFDEKWGDRWINHHNGRDTTTVEAEFRLPRKSKR